MTNFEDIRPYHDGEVKATIERLLNDAEFIEVICAFKLSGSPAWLRQLLKPLAKRILRKELSPLQSVEDVQILCERYVHKIIDTTTTQLTFSGLENLSKGTPYFFMSNHRDIVMDPTFINFALYHHGLETAQQAIGDNLIQKPFVSDLMRLNKSFIVKRSASGVREKMQAYTNLSGYIQHAINTDNSIWIAQKEGRAKDGIDRTDPTIIKMLYMSQKKSGVSFSDYMNWLKIVPVSISYEYNPCDQAISHELYETQHSGSYQKIAGEDIKSIVTGITGNKGDVHVAFGKPLSGELTDAETVATQINQQILQNYRLHASNYVAAELLQPETTRSYGQPIDAHKREAFLQRLNSCEGNIREFFLTMYANPVIQLADSRDKS